MFRLFVGIPLPNSYQERMMSLTGDLALRLKSRINWTKPGNAHVTLKFLGPVDHTRIDAIADVLSTIDFPPFYIRAGGCSCFPDENNPRVLWAGIMKGATACTELAKNIETTLEPLGFKRDRGPFKSHMTLGRIKRLASDNWLEILRKTSGVWPGFLADRFVLWKSDLTPDGPIYSVVKEFALQSEGK